MAQAMGAAPRYFGSSEAWTLIPPSGATARTSLDRICPYAATTSRSGRNSFSPATPSGVLTLSGCKTGTLCSRAISFMPTPTCRVEPRSWPTARSGCVTRPTTSWRLASRAWKVGAAKVPVPIMTMRMEKLTSHQRGRLSVAGLGRRLGRPGRWEVVGAGLQGGEPLEDLRVGWDLAALLGATILALQRPQHAAARQLGDCPHLVNKEYAIEV